MLPPEDNDSLETEPQDFEQKRINNNIIKFSRKNINDKGTSELAYHKDADLGWHSPIAEEAHDLLPLPRSIEVENRKYEKLLGHSKKTMLLASKRDNIQRDINSDFPARRHYEAEGRANEDSDMSLLSASRLTSAAFKNPSHKKKLHVIAQKHPEMVNHVISSIKEAKKSGQPIPTEYLQFITSFGRNKSVNSDVEDYNEGYEHNDLCKVHESQCDETINKNSREISIKRADEKLENEPKPDQSSNQGIEHISKEVQILKFEQQLEEFDHLLRDILSPVERGCDDLVRLSGEGGCTLLKSVAENTSISSDQAMQNANVSDKLKSIRNISDIEHQYSILTPNFKKKGISTTKKENNLLYQDGNFKDTRTSSRSLSNSSTIPKHNVECNSTLICGSNYNDDHNEKSLDLLSHSKITSKYCESSQKQYVHNKPISNLDPVEHKGASLIDLDTFQLPSANEKLWEENNQSMRILGSQFDRERHIKEDTACEPNLQRSCLDVPQDFSSIQSHINPALNLINLCEKPMQQRRSGVSSTLGKHYSPSSGSFHERHTMPSGSQSNPAAAAAPKDNQHLPLTFIQQLKNQIDSLNSLCQGQLQKQISSSMSMHQTCDLNMHNYSPEFHPCHQQFLLCLSQCCHTLYMQQLEIQRLHQSSQNLHAAAIQPQNTSCATSSMTEFQSLPHVPFQDTMFQPHLYNLNEIFPRPESYLSVPLKPFDSQASLNSRLQSSEPNCISSDVNKRSQETLNNKVPPRTRANNYFDNFRSHARQNLLSISTLNNIKSNENVSTVPQIRHDSPIIFSENQESCELLPHLSHGLNRSDPLVLNSILKKSNFNSSDGTMAKCRSNEFFKSNSLSSHHTVNSSEVGNFKHEKTFSQSKESSLLATSSKFPIINATQLSSYQDRLKIGSHSSSHSQPSSNESSIPPEQLSNTDFLFNLWQEAKGLKCDIKRTCALKFIRDLIIGEKLENEHIQNKSNNDSSPAECSSNISTLEVLECCDEQAANERLGNILFLPDNSSLSTQNSSTSGTENKSISANTASTGAIQKKTKTQSVRYYGNPSEKISFEPQTQVGLSDFNSITSLQEENNGNRDFLQTIIENILLDLRSVLPSRQVDEDTTISFWSSINAYLISRIRAHMNVPLPHKSLATLRQSLDRILPQFAGMKFYDCESDFFNYVSQLLYENLTAFISSGRFVSNPSLNIVSDESSETEMFDKIHDLSVKACGYSRDKVFDHNSSQENAAVVQESSHLNFELNICSTGNSLEIPQAIIHNSSSNKFEFNHEFDAEPEIEACTEADLAEADQSQSQLGNISKSSILTSDISPLDLASDLFEEICEIGNNFNFPPEDNEILEHKSFNSNEISENCEGDEINLDAVPTKLSFKAEEGLQIVDEHSFSVIPLITTRENIAESDMNDQELTLKT